MQTATDIIKKLMKEGHITVDEFIILYDAIRPSNITYYPNTTPYPPSTGPTITCYQQYKNDNSISEN